MVGKLQGLRSTTHKAALDQSLGIRTVIYGMVGQVLLDLLRKDIIREVLDAQKRSFRHQWSHQGVVKEVAYLELVYGAYCNFC